jgi:AcrR family transcriptional regulator
MIARMRDTVKPSPARRRYDASRRQAAAAQTRQSIAAAARELFITHGYAMTTVAAIAAAAGVAHDTVYATFGPKPALFRHVVELALSGAQEPIPALERDIVRAVQAEPDQDRVLELMAHNIRLIHERLAPLFDVLSAAAQTDAELKAFADELGARHVVHMRAFVEHLAAKGGLRPGLTHEMAADVIWVTTASEFYLLCVRGRGWTPAVFEIWLADTWKRILLPLEDDQVHRRRSF